MYERRYTWMDGLCMEPYMDNGMTRWDCRRGGIMRVHSVALKSMEDSLFLILCYSRYGFGLKTCFCPSGACFIALFSVMP